MIAGLLNTLLFVSAVFLILLVLVQRGRGGGLAGALGGMGGQSAFGTKAGDVFTKITIGVAAFWIVLCSIAVAMRPKGDVGPFAGGQSTTTQQTQPQQPAGAAPGPQGAAPGTQGSAPGTQGSAPAPQGGAPGSPPTTGGSSTTPPAAEAPAAATPKTTETGS